MIFHQKIKFSYFILVQIISINLLNSRDHFFYLKYIYLTGIYTLGLTTTSSPNVLGRTIMFVSDMVARPAPGSGNHARKYCRSRNLLLWIVMVVSLSISHLIFSRDVSLAFLFFSFIASSLPF
jgi:hypothetical protein